MAGTSTHTTSARTSTTPTNSSADRTSSGPSGRASRTTERDFQKAVLDLLRIYGYTVAHFRPAQTSHGWRTPVQADGKGFPDLVIAGHGRVFFRELKTLTGRLSDDQSAWLTILKRSGADAAVWRPDMWPEIQKDIAP